MLHGATQKNGSKQVLISLLAIVFEISAVVLPAGIMFGRITNGVFAAAKPLSGSTAAVASRARARGPACDSRSHEPVRNGCEGQTSSLASWISRQAVAPSTPSKSVSTMTERLRRVSHVIA
jgi:hypothetical protein